MHAIALPAPSGYGSLTGQEIGTGPARQDGRGTLA
jgi:hypothetical protein